MICIKCHTNNLCQALVLSLGNPQTSYLSTFGEFSNLFVNAVFRNVYHFERIDVLFDRYLDFTIKERSRTKREKGKPIRRAIDKQEVPLPHDWQIYISNSENKANLA